MKKLLRNFIWFFLIFLAIAAVFSAFQNKKSIEKAGLQAMVAEVKSGQVKSIDVSGDSLLLTLQDGRQQEVKKETGESLASLMSDYQIDPVQMASVAVNVKDQSGMDIFVSSVLPILLPMVLLGVFLFFMMRGMAGANSKAMSFGQSQAKEFNLEKKEKITFKDVAGAKEAKEELKEVVEFLKFPKKFHDLGARIPRGVLLLGGPGTGKTLMARAVAGEAGVPFFHMSGSEFVEIFVGVGASRVRSLFEKAKKTSPCIIFIDEIDAVGRRRGTGLGGGHDEREQTLNQILVEMDGFETTNNVIVIAATNRPDVLDPALLRPGRFDRRVMIDNPDLKDREAILLVHAQKKPLAKDADLKFVAERTAGFSGADLANVLNEAAILAARQNKKEISMEDLFESIEKVMIGPERRSRVITDKEKKITAYHEAGHALVAHFSTQIDPVQKVSIIARGNAGGYTLKVPLEDRHMHSRSEFVEELAVLLGGHLTEKDVFGEVTTGATSDLRRATALARAMITEYGMSDKLGTRTFGDKEEMVFLGREIHENRDYSEKTAETIDGEVSGLLSLATEQANKIINAHREALEKIVEVLLEKETLEKVEFDALLGAKPPKFD